MSERDLRGSALWAEIEDFYRRGLAGSWGRPYAVSEPALAPDGTTVAYVGEGLDDLEGRPWKRVYTASTTEPARAEPVSMLEGAARAPAWSPSGRWLAFIATVEGSDAVRYWEKATGRVVDGPAFATGVDRFVWAHHTDVLLAWSAERGQELGTSRPAEEAAWLPAVRSTLSPSVQEVVSHAPGDAAPVPWEGLGALWVWEAAWVDAATIVVIASDRAEPANWYRARLFLSRGSDPREILRPPLQAGALTTSPDGKQAAWIDGLASDRGMIAGAAVVTDFAGGPTRRLELDTGDITDLRWRDAGTLTYLGLDDLDTVAGEIDASALTARETWRTSGTCGMPMPSGAPAGEGRVLVAYEDWQHPPRLRIVGAGEPAEVPVGPEAEGVSWLRGQKGSMRPVRWSTPDGLELSGLLAVPAGDAPHPLVINVHGGPVWAWRNSWDIVFHTPVSLLVSRGFAVLQPNGRGSVGRGPELTDAILGAMGGADLQDYTSAAAALVEEGVADPRRICVIGHSYGGLVACALAGATDVFAAAVALSPATDWVSQHYVSAIPGFDELFTGPLGPSSWGAGPISKAATAVTPTLVVGCQDDDCTPVGQAIEFYRALAEHGGAPAALAVYPGEGHGIRGWPALLDQSVRIVDWFTRYTP